MEEKEFVTEEKEKTVKKSGFATAGLVCGIIGVCTSFIPIVNNASFFLGILALIFGIIPLIKKASIGKAVAAIILAILSVVITLVMQAAVSKAIDDAVDEFNEEMDYISGDKTEDIIGNYLDVKIGSFEVIEGEYYDETKLKVTLKNLGKERASFNVKIEAVDANGNRLNTDYIYASELGAGQSQTFEIFTLLSDDDISSMKSATFKIMEVSMY